MDVFDYHTIVCVDDERTQLEKPKRLNIKIGFVDEHTNNTDNSQPYKANKITIKLIGSLALTHWTNKITAARNRHQSQVQHKQTTAAAVPRRYARVPSGSGAGRRPRNGWSHRRLKNRRNEN